MAAGMIDAADFASDMEDMIGVGEAVTLQRPSIPPITATVRARVMGYKPSDLVGAIVQGDRQAIILADDLAASGFPQIMPNRDRLVWNGKTLVIKSVDDATARIAGETIAVKLQLSGA